MFVTEAGQNVSIIQLFQQDVVLYLLWDTQAQEQMNQKSSDLIGKKQIGSCWNSGIPNFTELSHITLYTTKEYSKLGGNNSYNLLHPSF